LKPHHFLLPVVFSLYIMLLWVINPTLILYLARQGHLATAIGVFTAVPYLAIMLMTPALPWLNRRYSMKRLFLISAVIETVLLLGYLLSDALVWWYLIALASGVVGAVVWILAESMIALDAPDGEQGRYMGIYQTVMGLAMALGPVLAANLPLDLHGLVVLVFLAYGVLIGVLYFYYHWPKASTATHDAHEGHGAVQRHDPSNILASLRYAWVAIPLLLVASLVGGAFEGGLDSLGIVAALPHFEQRTALYVPAVIALGSLFAQYPLGFLADHKGSTWVMRLMALLLVVNCLLFALLFERWPNSLWPIALVWGACGGSMYTLSMTMVSRSAKDQRLVASMGLLVLCYAMGKMAGPVMGGAAYDTAGPWAMGVCFALFAAFGLWFAWRADLNKPI
jgi:MFS family permease